MCSSTISLNEWLVTQEVRATSLMHTFGIQCESVLLVVSIISFVCYDKQFERKT